MTNAKDIFSMDYSKKEKKEGRMKGKKKPTQAISELQTRPILTDSACFCEGFVLLGWMLDVLLVIDSSVGFLLLFNSAFASTFSSRMKIMSTILRASYLYLHLQSSALSFDGSSHGKA